MAENSSQLSQPTLNELPPQIVNDQQVNEPNSAFEDENSNNPSGLHNGRPIPKQTAAGALLTGGLNTHKVYIGNLPETATLADLEDCFGQLGQCTCSIKRGFGFVDYTEPASAAEAVAKYHEGHFLGAQIKVELSHARASIPKAPEDGKSTARNPPGSDRPSDARKPMHINGPPTGGAGQGQGKPRFNNNNNNNHNNFNNHNGNNHNSNNNFREPRGPPQNDYPSRRSVDDRWANSSRDGPPPPSFRGGAGEGPSYGNDRYRDDYRDSRDFPPPASAHSNYQDPRYPPRGEFDRYSGAPPPREARGPPPPLGGYNNGPSPPRDARDRPPYDPYYDAPSRGSGSDFPPYAPHRPLAPMSPVYGNLPLSSDRSLPPLARGGSGDPYDRFNSGPPPSSSFDGPSSRAFNDHYDNYDPRGPPPSLNSTLPAGGREERNNRFNPYSRISPPRDDGRNGYNGRSPRGPPNDRRSMSPPPRLGSGPPPYSSFDNGSRGPSGGYGGGDRYNGGGDRYNGGGGPPQDEYNPRR